MKKRNTLSLLLLSLACVTGCSASTPGGTETFQETNEPSEQSAEDVSSESTAESIESSEESAVSTEETEDTEDTSSAETTTNEAAASMGDIFGLDGERLYNTRVELCPDCVYSAGEWLSEDGHLVLPFDENAKTEHDDDLDYKFGRYYIPEEALKAASTEDLLSICTDTYFAMEVIAFERLDYQVTNLASNLNAVDAVFAREDFAKALLQAYQEDTLDPQEAGMQKEYKNTYAVITEELFLARNEVFDQMTDEMREETLSEVMKKLELIESGEYYYFSYGGSCFFYYVKDLYDDGNGKWYEYLEEHHPEYLEYCEHSVNYR